MTVHGLPSVSVYALLIDPQNPNIVYAGTKDHGVYKTINGGEAWATMNPGLENLTVEDLALGNATPPTLHTATKDGAYWWFWPQAE